MDYNFKDPFGYAWYNYLWVILVSGFAGFVKYLNSKKRGSARKAVTAVLTSGITGIMTFWLIKWKFPDMDGAGLAFFVAVGGLMGSTAWRELETIVKTYLQIRAGMLSNSTNDKEGNDK